MASMLEFIEFALRLLPGVPGLPNEVVRVLACFGHNEFCLTLGGLTDLGGNTLRGDQGLASCRFS
ncbi:MAG: hypothetical protein O3A25_11575 [Acidobacteria bacterium]|nr:hypothetical protein [Acidobacteriota bacterium]